MSDPLCWNHPDAWDTARVEEVWQDSGSPTGWFAWISIIRHNKNNAPADYDICYPNRWGQFVFKKQVQITAEAAKAFQQTIGLGATILGVLGLGLLLLISSSIARRRGISRA